MRLKLAELKLPCNTIRRHSCSSPAILQVEACQARVLALTEKVTNITSRLRTANPSSVSRQVKYHSISDLRPESMATMGDTDHQVKTVRLCHHCHAPQSNSVHVGIPTGSGHCTLPHWEECTLQKVEGYDKHKKWWTGCPDMEKDVDDLDTTEEDGLETAKNSSNSSLLIDDEEVKIKTPTLPRTLEEAADLLEIATGLEKEESGEDTEDEENRHYAAEVQELKRRVEQQQIEEDRLLALKTAQKEKRRSERLQQRSELEKQRAELLQRETQLQQRAAAGLSSSRLTQSAPRSTTANTSTSAKEAAARKLQLKAASHAAKQQQTAADRLQQQNSNLMNIAGIRQLPGMTPEVESHLTNFQSTIPSLARDPNAGGQFQPPGVYHSGHMSSHTPAGSFSVAPGYVYVAELGQLVPTVASLGAASGTAGAIASGGQGQKTVRFPEQVLSDSEVSADEDCPVSPAPGNRLVWRRDSDGRKYCEEKIVRDKTPEIIETWVKRADGRIYKEQVAKDKTRGLARAEVKPKGFVDYRQATAVRGQNKSSAGGQVSREERLPTFVSTEERGGKETSVPSLVKCARLCPVAWTAKITSDQLNPIIWSWAYIAELLATRTGQAPDLPAGELEARLQHFLNVMEVTLQTSTKADYMGDSWKVGRLYHNKVQAKMDQGMTTWCKMMERWESATLPHELMAAQQELAPKQVKKPKDADSKLRDGDSKPPRCGTWNTWETKGTCRWESENPGQKCNRVHECTYCKTKKYKQVNHQRLFCPKRIEAGSD